MIAYEQEPDIGKQGAISRYPMHEVQYQPDHGRDPEKRPRGDRMRPAHGSESQADNRQREAEAQEDQAKTTWPQHAYGAHPSQFMAGQRLEILLVMLALHHIRRHHDA